MGKANFSDDFKRDAVAQITERGYPVAEVSDLLAIIITFFATPELYNRTADFVIRFTAQNYTAGSDDIVSLAW